MKETQKNDEIQQEYKFDYLVFIGRFQPFHLGHYRIIETALKQAERVIVLVGSSVQPRSLRNPWTFLERKTFIQESFGKQAQNRIKIVPLLDDVYNEEGWLSRVQQGVYGIVSQFPPKIGSKAPKIGLIGHSKDHSSYYLSLFPQWGNVTVADYQGLSATPLRASYFLEAEIGNHYPKAVQELLRQFQTQREFHDLAEEWRFIDGYKMGWEKAPYAPTFVTVDAIVVQSGHVLLVERKARPGKGLLALPGGFIGSNERLKDAMIRELREETKIKVPEPVLAGSVVAQQVFDDPHRSARGRTITHAFFIKLKPDAKGLPKVKGGDDARHARWVPLGGIDPERIFEDHFHIINAMID